MNQKETPKESEKLIFSPLEYLNRSGTERGREERRGFTEESQKEKSKKKKKLKKLLRKLPK